jgi:hypothetical protein
MSTLCLAVLILVTIVSVPVLSQSTGGRVLGRVADTTGAVLAGVKVTLVNEATGVLRDTQTNDSGDYVFLEVPVGSYRVEFELTGFKKDVRAGVHLDLNQVATLNMIMQIGATQEIVDVTSQAPVVDTTSTQLGAVVSERSATQLPLNERDAYQLLQLQPGVQSQIGNSLFYGSDKPGVVTVNGGRGRSNNYSVNGGDANDQFANLPAVQPSPDSIEEFRVLSNTFDAEYGRNSGAVVNVVTKSGTNQFHGSLFEFFRNDVLNAHQYAFNTTIKPPFKQNQFGGTLGGPIKKDKTFFFGSYEGRRIVRGIVSIPVPVPNAAELAGNFGSSGSVFGGTLTDQTVTTILQTRCGSQINALGGVLAAGTPYSSVFPTGQIPTQCFDPVAVSFLQYLPGAGGASSQVQDVTKSTDRGDQAQFRLDHAFTGNQRTSIYYYYDNDNSLDPFANFQAAGAALGNFPGQLVTHSSQLNGTHTSTLGNTAVNEFRFTWFREAQPKFYTPTRTNAVTASCGTGAASAFCFTGTSDTSLVSDGGTLLGNTPPCTGFGCGIHPNLGPKIEGVPEINFNTTNVIIGNNFEGQLPQTGNTFQWTDNFSKIIGNHSLKFGGDFRLQRFDQTVYFNVNGDFTFSAGGSNDVGYSNLYPDFLLGLPNTYTQGSANTERVRSKAIYLFAQDSWKIRPNLTLNYGLRWEFNTPLTDVGKKVQTFRPGQNTTKYPCNSDPNCNTSTFPTGLLVPGDPGVPAGLSDTYHKAFAPRLGLNWSPGTSGKTSISTGWGLFYNPIEQLVLEQFVAEPPFGISNSVSNPLLSTPFVDQTGTVKPNVANGILSPPQGTPVDWALYRPILLFGQFPKNLRTQYSAQYNLTVKRELPNDILVQVGYVGSQGHRLLASHDLNFANAQTCLDLAAISTATGNTGLACSPFGEDSSYFVPAGTTIPAQGLHLPYNAGAGGLLVPGGTVVGPNGITLVGTRPFSSPNCQPLTGVNCPADGTPVFSSIFSEDNSAHSNYNSLQALVEKRFSHGIQFQASYTYSKSLDNASSFEDLLNPLSFEATYGPSLYDARHRFVFNYVWDLPIPKMEGFRGKMFNGWQVSGIFTYQTGFPILIISPADNELMGTVNGFEPPGEPNIVAPFRTQDPKTHGGFAFDPNLFNSAPFDPLLNPQGVPLGTFGNSPRKLCCNSPINNWDMGFYKDIPFTERLKMEFRGEVYNIWNHAQFFSIDGNVGNQGTTFGQPQKTRDPRLVQFALKLLF